MTDPAREAAERIVAARGNSLDDLEGLWIEKDAVTVARAYLALPTAGDREALAKLICCPGGCEGARGCDWTEPDCVKRADAILTWMSASGLPMAWATPASATSNEARPGAMLPAKPRQPSPLSQGQRA